MLNRNYYKWWAAHGSGAYAVRTGAENVHTEPVQVCESRRSTCSVNCQESCLVMLTKAKSWPKLPCVKHDFTEIAYQNIFFIYIFIFKQWLLCFVDFILKKHQFIDYCLTHVSC